MLLLIVYLLSVTSAEDPLRAVLRSPKASLRLYSEFKEKNHLSFGVAENSQRFREFLSSAGHVADYNEDETDTGHYGVNKFSVMTEEEKRAYHGLNITLLQEDEALESLVEEEDLALDLRSLPDKVLWTNSEAVTEVKDQGSCGSCWAFTAVGAIETRYKVLSGVLRSFSEQEFLDCAYESQRSYDGCDGGTITQPYRWSINNGGRLAATTHRRYEKKDKTCRSSTTPDGMVAYKISSYKTVRNGEYNHIQALQDGTLASTIIATDKFHQYEDSIMKDTTCKDDDRVNHGVVLVGYSSDYVVIKNSWGKDWGEKGFAKLARNHANCKLFTTSYYPTFRSTGKKDSGSDAATTYRPELIVACMDFTSSLCSRIERNGCCTKCDIYNTPQTDHARQVLVSTLCRKTCGICGSKGECPGGTVKCGDGVCRHEHMCPY